MMKKQFVLQVTNWYVYKVVKIRILAQYFYWKIFFLTSSHYNAEFTHESIPSGLAYFFLFCFSFRFVPTAQCYQLLPHCFDILFRIPSLCLHRNNQIKKNHKAKIYSIYTAYWAPCAVCVPLLKPLLAPCWLVEMDGWRRESGGGDAVPIPAAPCSLGSAVVEQTWQHR
jgi:hypothetical protein